MSQSRGTKALVEAIGTAIDGLAIGDEKLFGTEAELIRRFGVSRSSLRETIREFERNGSAQTQRGTGIILQSRPNETAQLALTGYVDFAGISWQELYETYLLVRTYLARLATLRATDDDLAVLRAAQDEGLDEVSPLVSAMARNRALELIADTLHRFIIGLDAVVSGSAGRMVSEAIVSGDSIEADGAMRRVLADRYLGALSRVGNKPARLPLATAAKLAEVTARQIVEWIEAEGFSAGTRLGTEAELVARFGTSRAILREALRMLERHACLVGRRGPNGGIFVDMPDPAFAIATGQHFLRKLKLTADELTEARLSLQPKSAALTARTASQDDIRALSLRLRADAREEMVTPEDDRLFHIEVARMSGNRLLAILAETLMSVFYKPTRKRDPEFLRRTHLTNLRMFDAIAAGDPALAHRRTIEHLDWSLQWLRGGEAEF